MFSGTKLNVASAQSTNTQFFMHKAQKNDTQPGMRLAYCFLFLIFTIPAFASECELAIGSCDYYLCRERVQSCGETGYFLAYGYKYCTALFAKAAPKMSPSAAAWLERASVCLQESAETNAETASCKDAETTAISSHANCYVQTGFCEIPFVQRLEVLKVIYKEIFDLQMLKQMQKTLELCADRTSNK